VPVTLRPVGPNPSVNVRRATEEDVGFLVDVVIVTARSQGRVGEDFDESAWRTSFAAETLRQVHGEVPHDSTYVIDIDGERAGRLRLVQAPDSRELAGLQLLPAHQGKGLGTHLVEQFLVDAREQGLPARVDVQRDNPRARALYERLGFVEVGDAEASDALADGDVRLEWRR
jgi:ribosomal protein S18 acetylase RimI-like enzyme